MKRPVLEKPILDTPMLRGKLWYVFLACIIILSASGLAAIVAVLLFAFDVTGSETAIVILCIAVAIAAAAGVLSILMSRMVLDPVTRLSEASQHIARGEFDLNLRYEGSVRELRTTYDSFNVMARELSNIETLRSDFIANVSHEFKTPLAAIEGYAMLLQEPDLTEEEREDCTRKILDSTGRLSSLVSNILMLSKLEQQTQQPEIREFRLDEQIRQVMVELEPVWGEKQLQLELELQPVTFRGSESLLYHVWSNLIGNAVKFSPSGELLRVELLRTAAGIRFLVTDRGPGMSRDVQRHIFDKFYQGDPSRRQEGAGLGLALVRRITQLCGGAVWVRSAPGEGSTFAVDLPDGQ